MSSKTPVEDLVFFDLGEKLLRLMTGSFPLLLLPFTANLLKRDILKKIS